MKPKLTLKSILLKKLDRILNPNFSYKFIWTLFTFGIGLIGYQRIINVASSLEYISEDFKLKLSISSGADNLLICIGVIAVAVSCFFFYRVLTDDNEFANEIREVKEKNSNPSQVGIFIFQNNNFIFESAKDPKEIKNNQIDHSAKVLFTLPGFEIDNSHNISSIIDNGTGDISIIFANDLPSKNYYTEISGNKNIEIYDIEKSKGYLRVKFNEKGIDYLQIICDAN